MGEGTAAEPASFQLGTELRLTLVPDNRLKTLQVRVNLTRSHALQLALLRGDEVLQTQALSLERRTADLFLELDAPHTLQVSDPERGTQHRIPLT